MSTNDISFVNPSTGGVTSKSKTQVISDAMVEIPFWAVSDPDLVAKEPVALEIEVIGSNNEYGQQLSSLYIEPVVFNVAELIPSLSTRYTNAMHSSQMIQLQYINMKYHSTTMQT